MLLNTACSQLTRCCLLKIAAGGRSLRRSPGGLVRTAFWLVCSSQQLVPGRFGAVGLHGPRGDAGARLGEGERTMAAAEQEEGMQLHPL